MAAIETDGQQSFLGYGLVRPIQRAGGNDFVAAGGERLIRSAIGQILGTKPGDLRWRPSFGCDLERFRHANMDEGLLALVRAAVAGALRIYEPRIQLTNVTLNKDDTKLLIMVTWQVIDVNTATNQTLLGPIETEVSV